MKKTLIRSILILLSLLCLAAIITALCVLNHEITLDELQQAALQELEQKKGEYDEHSIVLYDTTPVDAKQLAEKLGATLRISKDGRFATLTLPNDTNIIDVYANKDNRAYIEKMSADYSVRIADLTGDENSDNAEKNLLRPNYTVKDKLYASQTYLDYLNVGDAWHKTKGKDITIAVIDTGIDTDHPEFEGRISEYSYNASEDKILKDWLTEDGSYEWSLIEDEVGHGTAVTGVIAAQMNNVGITGLAPEVNIIVIKAACSPSGAFYRTSDLVFGLYYAIERDASVVNMSFGTYDSSNPFRDAIQLAFDSDVICVAAAGNDATTKLCYPAADPHVFGIGALAPDSWNLAEYSNYGENVNFVAPGSTFTTLIDGEYGIKEGTSLASPLATAAIALYISQNKYVEFKTLEEQIYASCHDLGGLGADYLYGYGALDVNALVCEERGKITFNMLSDELENSEQIFIRNHTLQNIPEPERLYAVFDGWYYDIACTEPYNWYEDVFTSNLTLYANWVNEDDGIPFRYVELDDGTIEILSYTGKRRFITIPDTIDGKIVSSIGNAAFQGEDRLRQVGLPQYLKRIGDNAFDGCLNLTDIVIPASVTSIGTSAFKDNMRLYTIVFEGTGALTSIGDYAFMNCANLERIELPASLQNVSVFAFFGTSSLKAIHVRQGNQYFASIDGVLTDISKQTLIVFPAGIYGTYEIPSCIKKIGDYAFYNSRIKQIDLCSVTNIGQQAFRESTLESIQIPDSVVVMGAGAFYQCYNLADVTIGSGLKTIPSSAFSDTAVEEILIPKNIESIGLESFSLTPLQSLTFAPNSTLHTIEALAFSNTDLSSITFPKSLELIGENAFSTTPLSSVIFEAGSQLKTIDNLAFDHTPQLTQITLPEGLKSIGMSAFGSSGLTTVYIPASVANISAPFVNCDNLTEIKVAKLNPNYKDIDGVLYSQNTQTLVEYPAGKSDLVYTVPDGVTLIASYAFNGSDILTEIYLPDSLQSIYGCAFLECMGLEMVALPNVDVKISEKAFANCISLLSITFPDNITTVGKAAFSNCASLTSINIGKGYTVINPETFAYCTSLPYITLPDTVTRVAPYAFTGCASLTRINIGKGLSLLEEGVFSYCTSLPGITIPDNIKQVGKLAFQGDWKLSKVTISETTQMTRIGKDAFAYCGLTSFRVPANISTIAQEAFEGCSKLQTFIFSKNSKLESISAYMFDGCENLQNITFESGSALTSIQAHGLEGMSKLKAVNFGDAKVTNIDNFAFRFCSSLASLTLPETVTNIGRFAFYECNALKEITIPAGIEHIGRYAFWGTDNINLYFKGGNTPLYLDEYWDEGICAYHLGVEEVITDDLYQYAILTGGHISIIEYLGTDTVVDLSSHDFGGSVTCIGGKAFYLSDVTSIQLPETLVTIQADAFAGSQLTNVTIPASVEFIGREAFYNTPIQSLDFAQGTRLRTIEHDAFAYTTALTSVVIPASVEILGSGVFEASGLTHLTFEDGIALTEIPERAFASTHISAVNLPDSVTILNHGAFRDNMSLSKVNFGNAESIQILSNVFYHTGLTQVNIPANIEYIGEYAFVGLENLHGFTVDPNHAHYTAKDGVLMSKDERKLIAFPAGKTGEYAIPESVEIIGFGSFENSKLSQISFHPNANILTLGYRAFYGAKNIQSITLPESVVSIDYYAFANCTSLEKVVFVGDNKLKGIYEGAFYGCKNLYDITIPDSIVEISDFAFYGCIALEKLPISDTSDVLGIYDYAFAYTGIEELELPDTLIDIGNYAFMGLRVKNVILPDQNAKQLVIGLGAFADCLDLESITLPFFGASFENPDISWFGYIFGAGASAANGVYTPESLKTVTITEGITTIQTDVFSHITTIEILHLPHSVTIIEPNAFKNFTATYELSGEILTVSDFDRLGLPSEYVAKSGHFGKGLRGEVTLAEGVTEVGPGAFENCVYLEGITLSDSVTTFKGHAVNGCINLKSIVLGKNVSHLEGSGALNTCPIEKLVVPEDNPYLVEIDGVIYDRELTTVQYIRRDVVSVSLPDTITDIGTAFFSLKNIQSLVIPEGVTSVSFYGCTNLRNVTLPSSLTSIGSFGKCTSLESIVIPEGVKSIGQQAFEGCSSLSSITLPSTLTSVGPYAFMGCNKLWVIYNNSDLPLQFNSSNYGEITQNARMIVDKNGNKSYKSGIQEMEFLDAIDNFRFVKANGNYILIAYLGSQETITLPKDINGMTYQMGRYPISLPEQVKHIIIPDGITSIDESAFSNLTNIESIHIPNSVTTIGDGAFAGCDNLKSIILPDSVTSIGEQIFLSCDRLETVTLGKGITAISNYAFRYCYSLKLITIPDGVQTIGKFAFNNCPNLESIVIPDSVTSIGQHAFSYCEKLNNIKLGKNVAEISTDAFLGSPYETLTISEENQNLIEIDGIIYDKDLTTIKHVKNDVVCVSIPYGVTSINDNAFIDCTELESISLPHSITSIGDQAFFGCVNLKSINIPGGVTAIGAYTFSGCKSLTTITIPENITSVSLFAFSGCESLKEVHISNLAKWCQITFESDESNPLSFEGNLYLNGKLVTELIIPDGLKKLSGCFDGCASIKYVSIPHSVTSIGNRTFKNCVNLTSIDIPDSVTSIGYSSFENCVNLTSIDIPDSVTSIGSSAFSGCTNLESITIPNGVKSIASDTFRNCINLTHVDIPNSVTSIGLSAFRGCTNLESITIPNSVKSIGSFAFQQCSKLSSIDMSNSITTIGTSAFDACISLASIHIPHSITRIEDTAFRSCTSLLDIDIPEGVISIGKEAFSGCTFLTSVTIPSSVTSIEDRAFGGCSMLFVIYNNSHLTFNFKSTSHGYIANNAKMIVDTNGNKTYADKTYSLEFTDTPDGFRFMNDNGVYKLISYVGKQETVTLPKDFNGKPYQIYKMHGVKNVIIPDGITAIDNYAFNGCLTLESITIPNSVTSIGVGAFSNCKALQRIVLPDSVHNIMMDAFSYCTNLQSIDLGNGVWRIQDGAFKGCKSLACITLPDSVNHIASEAFFDCTLLANISMGEGIKTLGNDVFLGTPLYEDPQNWDNGTLIIDQCLIKLSPETEYFTNPDIKCIALNALNGCYQLKVLRLTHTNAPLSDLTNLETIIFSDIPSGFSYQFPNGIPVTLRNFVLTEGIKMADAAFRAFSGITIYVEDTKVNAQHWDENYIGWHNNNKIIYGEKWNYAIFYRANGELTNLGIVEISKVIRVPYVKDYTQGHATYTFEGFDTNGDGVADSIPATANNHIEAVAIFNIHCTHDSLTTTLIKEPTCTEDGLGFDVCDDCGKTFAEKIINAKGHTSVIALAVDATCTYPGLSQGKHCKVCDAVIIPQEIIPTVEHPEAIIPAVEATCTKTGLTQGSYCSMCGITLIKQTVTPITSHVYENWQVIKEATCTSPGSEKGTCVCGRITTRQIPRLDHVYENWEILRQPTCIRTGLESGTCVCGRTFAREIPIIDHNEVITPAQEPTCTKTGLSEGTHCSMCKMILVPQETLPIISHTPIIDPAVDATCTQYGWSEGSHCDSCGMVMVTQERLPMLNHVYENWQVTREPTCSQTGLEQGTCICGRTSSKSIPMLDHVYENWQVTREPTCSQTGLERGTCICGKTSSRSIPMLDHVFENWQVTREPTCSQTGLERGTCVCGRTFAREIPIIDHNEVITPAQEPTCTKTGLSEGTHCSMCKMILVPQETLPIISHTPIIDPAVDATCTKYGWSEGSHCDSCGMVMVTQERLPMLDHVFKNWQVTREPTCSQTGLEQGTCICGRTSPRIIPMLDHVYENWQVITEPTCSQTGLERGTCICGRTSSRIIPMLDHVYENWQVTREPTCTRVGVERGTCSCGTTSSRNIPKTNHVEVIDPAVDATCTKYGWSEGSHCDSCGMVMITQERLPMLDHVFENWQVTREPSCTRVGVERGTCSCGTTSSRNIPKTNHVEVIDPAVDATCTQYGWSEGSHCDSCGEVMVTRERLPMLDHVFKNWQVTREPTCTRVGIERGTCICGQTSTRDIPSLEHHIVIDSAVMPTCTQTGLTEGKHCDRCGDILVSQDILSASGHTPGQWMIDQPAQVGVEGSRHKECSVCKEILEIDVIPALPAPKPEDTTPVDTEPVDTEFVDTEPTETETSVTEPIETTPETAIETEAETETDITQSEVTNAEDITLEETISQDVSEKADNTSQDLSDTGGCHMMLSYSSLAILLTALAFAAVFSKKKYLTK